MLLGRVLVVTVFADACQVFSCKGSKMFRVWILTVLLLISSSNNAKAVTINLSGVSDSSTVNIDFSGTATQRRGSAGFGFFNIFFGSEDFTTFVTTTTPVNGSLSVTNMSTGSSVAIDGMRVYQQPDGFLLNLSRPISGSDGQTFEFAGSGTLELGGNRTFDDFHLGTYTGAIDSPFPASPVFPDAVTLNVFAVPAPSTLPALGSLGVVGLVAAMRRRRRFALTSF